ncbi:MAG: T9SS type A sorting domain-containing protein [Syntrophomonadaceae bacterium]
MNVLKLVTILVLFALSSLSAQFEYPCGTKLGNTGQTGFTVSSSNLPTSPAMWRDGYEKTSKNELKVLVVFVRFKDDINSTSAWDNPAVLPYWAQTIVDPNVTAIGSHPGNLSDYLSLASGGDRYGNIGRFKVYGDVKYVVTSLNRNDYTDDYQYYKEEKVMREVMSTLDASPSSSNVLYGSGDVNFAQYDNWTFQSGGLYYTHVYNPSVKDNKVDHIFVVFRGGPLDGGRYGGEKSLTLYNTFTTNEGKQIDNGSGCRTFYAENGNVVPNMAHEYLHYCFAGAHWDDDANPWRDDPRNPYPQPLYNKGRLNSFALECCIGAGFVSTYEKYRMGWLDPIIVTTPMSSLVLYDSHRFNQAVMIPLAYDTYGRYKEYYWIENYVTPSESPEANPYLTRGLYNETFTHGLLVYHIKEENWEYATANNVSIICADGNWSWKLSTGASTPTDFRDDKIAKDYPTFYTGFSERDYIKLNVGGIVRDYRTLIHDSDPATETTKPDQIYWRYNENAWLGQNDDFFKEGYADVFDKYSNPAAYHADGTPTNVGFQIVSWNSTNKSYTLDIKTTENGVNALRPAKPEGLTINYSGVHPVLTWYSLCTDPAYFDGFKIYRKQSMYNTWSCIATVGPGVTSYTDSHVYHSGPYSFTYYVTALKGTLESIPSNQAGVSQSYLNKDGADSTKAKTEAKIISDKLLQNFPNPFNPTTSIYYTVKSDSKVILQVFDILGNKVAELVNEVKPAGEYTASFNGSSLPSGMYIYKLQCGSYSETRKMLLMK